MYELLKSTLINHLQLGAEDVVPTATKSEVGLDSVAVVELATVLSSRLGFEIHDYELQEATTIADIANLLEDRQKTAAAEPQQRL